MFSTSGSTSTLILSVKNIILTLLMMKEGKDINDCIVGHNQEDFATIILDILFQDFASIRNIINRHEENHEFLNTMNIVLESKEDEIEELKIIITNYRTETSNKYRIGYESFDPFSQEEIDNATKTTETCAKQLQEDLELVEKPQHHLAERKNKEGP